MLAIYIVERNFKMGFNIYILSVSFSFTRVHLTALFPVSHSQPLLLGCHTATDESWE